MAAYINIRSVSLLLSVIFLVLSLDGFVARKEISKLDLGVTILGEDLLQLRNKAIAFNTNSDITAVELFEHLLASKEQLTFFTEQAKRRGIDLFKQESADVNQLIDTYELEYLQLSQSIEKLIRLVMARNEALNNSPSPTPSLLAQKNAQIAYLSNEMLLISNTEFISETEKSLKEIGLTKLSNAFIFSNLALTNFFIFIWLSAWQQIQVLKRSNKKLKALSAKVEKHEDISKSRVLQKNNG